MHYALMYDTCGFSPMKILILWSKPLRDILNFVYVTDAAYTVWSYIGWHDKLELMLAKVTDANMRYSVSVS